MAKRRSGPKSSRRSGARSRDVALILHPTEDNEGFQIVRQRAADRPLEIGTVRPLRDGRPLDGAGEVITLRPRPDMPLVCDVKTELELPESRATSDGPAQVATDRYRRGWDAIWGTAAANDDGAKPN
jgi:hypothetical protein